MFKQLVPLNSDAHRELTFAPNQSFDFARQLVMIPLSLAELFKAARELVIVFPLEGGVPQALVGVESGKNLYINEAGQWIGRYVPAHLRRYPFILNEISTSNGERNASGRKFGLQVDIKSAHLTAGNGNRLFDEQGQPTEILEHVKKTLQLMQADFERTKDLIHQMDLMNLLIEKQLIISEKSPEPKQLNGVRVVNADVLSKLTGEQLADMRSSGILNMIYAHLISMTNLEDGWLTKAFEKQGSKTMPHEAINISFDQIDWNKINQN